MFLKVVNRRRSVVATPTLRMSLKDAHGALMRQVIRCSHHESNLSYLFFITNLIVLRVAVSPNDKESVSVSFAEGKLIKCKTLLLKAIFYGLEALWKQIIDNNRVRIIGSS